LNEQCSNEARKVFDLARGGVAGGSHRKFMAIGEASGQAKIDRCAIVAHHREQKYDGLE
jgi:hypothetical protein